MADVDETTPTNTTLLHAGDMVHELCHIKRSSFDSLAAYQGRLSFLRKRMPLVDCEFPEKAYLWIAINGLKEMKRYKKWAAKLVKDMEGGELTWRGLMNEMSAKAIKEVKEQKGPDSPAGVAYGSPSPATPMH